MSTRAGNRGRLPVVAANKLLEVAIRRGADRESLLRAAHLDPRELADPGGHVSMDAQYRLWEACVAATGDENLPVAVSRTYDLDTYNILAYACMTCADLRSAIRRLTRFIPLWVHGQSYAFDEDDGEGRITLHQVTANRPGYHYSALSAMIELVLGMRRVVEGACKPSWVCLGCARPTEPAPLEQAFDCRIEYGATAYVIALDEATLALPLRKADPGLATFFEEHAEQLLSESRTGNDVVERCRVRIRAALGEGDPSMKRVAGQLGASVRTLRRRLADEGTSFREIVEEVRREMAHRFLHDTDLPIADVAHQLGFSEPSNFHRAFKRWTGKTPDEYRRSASS